ncbi:sensor histidine kinase [Cohnella silvisoli]|uniref:Heme sensor protein HssS n=1 Tax=Cohnella silvisoli TaxID=2873699 RepID=A0ABV1KZT3_9BACL|nr:HAMP domain-containing sensor histidine kinase [Cohnella silvisoli]MCD9021803.1 HAMP domain-containing histidine kinase [Cohnella silvisoli]
MIRTLYVRVVLTYMAAVILGLICTYYLTLFLLTVAGERYLGKMKNELEADAPHIMEIYQQNGLDGADSVFERTPYKEQYKVRLYNREMEQLNSKDQNELANSFSISNRVIRSVLAGETYHGSDKDIEQLVFGLPYEQSGEHYALFIQISDKKLDSINQILLLYALLINLLVGSLFIFVAARYLVKPLRKMKEAAERMAKGEFDIELKWGKRKDELGQLAQSFNYMAGQLKQFETMRQNFVSNVSHEIQSPLTSISGFSSALLQSGVPEEDKVRYLTIIQAESERLSRLSDNLLQLASLDSQRHPFEPHVYDLDEQLRKSVVACEPQWSAKSLDWDLDLPRAKINADEDQLSQVWINLLSNSIKFTPDGGKISITIVKHTNLIEIRVTDTGIGIPEEDLGKVFERFYKADKSHNKKQSGSGLGLAIVKKIITRHRGTIVLSSKQGVGTTVTVTLPHRTA